MASRLVAFGEVMARFSPAAGEIFGQTPTLSTWFGGAEANAAATFAQLGGEALMLTTLPANALGRGALAMLTSRGIDARHIRVIGEGRLGLYFATYGAGVQPPEVLYDRAHSAFSLAPSLEHADAALNGAAFLHITGITPALSKETASASLALARKAVDAGVKVSFDGNYRAKLWQTWDGDGPSILRELLSLASVAFVDHRDITLLLGGQFGHAEDSERNNTAYVNAFAAFQRLELLATTQRRVISMTHHEIGACAKKRGQALVVAPPMAITSVVDRIGGGDAFAGAMLFSLSQGEPLESALTAALGACAIKHGQRGDIITLTPAMLADVMAARTGDIQR